MGIGARWPKPARYGVRRHFRCEPWSDLVEVHWGAVAEAYITPVDEDVVGVALLFGDRARRRPGSGGLFERLLADFPVVRDRLGPPCSVLRGAGPFALRTERRTRGRALLVGDAAGYVDPLTGEGLKLGFEAAHAAVAAIVAGDPAAYERQWWEITRTYRWLTGGLVRLGSFPPTRRCVVPVTARAPRLMAAIASTLAG